jgi:hypothetical protein
MRPKYVSQDKDNNEPNHRYHTRSRTTRIMQEAMLACIDITKPKFEISAAKLATRKFPVDMALQNGKLCHGQAR